MSIKVCCISDTHSKHQKIAPLEYSEILIHAGDFSSMGHLHEIESFVEWFADQNSLYKVLTCGNHEIGVEKHYEPILKELCLQNNINYLNNSGCELLGLKIYGSPISPWFHNWAFNKDRGAQIRQYWNAIPEDTDILVTHGPPHLILDACPPNHYNNYQGENVGCEDLLKAIEDRNIKLHVFGHIHWSYGKMVGAKTTFVNASICTERYEPTNQPIYVEL